MKLNISYNKSRYIIDVLPTDNIYKIKCKVQEATLQPRPCTAVISTKSRDTLLLNGTILKDDFVISDIGLVSGSTLQYKQIETEKWKLNINVKFLKRNVEFGKEICLNSTTVGDIRVTLQNELGIPMSLFYIVQLDDKREMFDMHPLSYYGIKEGDTLLMKVLKGTKGVITGALNADISRTMLGLPNFYENPTLNRYLLRATLFIAAHFDYTKLAALVLQRGIRCEEPVGEHPSRQWCLTHSHPGIFKAPIHQAAHMGSFQCVKMFIRHCPSAIICRDSFKMTPSNYASKYKHLECWKLLIASQFVHVRIGGFSLASHARIMKWCSAAKERVSYFKGDAKHSLLLHSTFGRHNNTYLGNSICVAGFSREIHNNKKTSDKQNQPNERSRNSFLPNILQKHNATNGSISDVSEKGIHRRPSSLKQNENKETLDNRDNDSHLRKTTLQPLSTDSSQIVILDSESSIDATRSIDQAQLKIQLVSNNDVKISRGDTKLHETGKESGPLTTNQSSIKNTKPKKVENIKLISRCNSHQDLLVHRGDKEIVSSPIKPILNRNIQFLKESKDPSGYHRSNSYSYNISNTKHNNNDNLGRRSSSTSSISNAREEEYTKVQDIIRHTTGMNSRDLANKCLQIGETFNGKPWIQQFNIALNSSTNRIKRGRPRSQVPSEI